MPYNDAVGSRSNPRVTTPAARAGDDAALRLMLMRHGRQEDSTGVVNPTPDDAFAASRLIAADRDEEPERWDGLS